MTIKGRPSYNKTNTDITATSRPVTRSSKRTVSASSEQEAVTASSQDSSCSSEDSSSNALTASSSGSGDEDSNERTRKTRDPLLRKKPARFADSSEEEEIENIWIEVINKRTRRQAHASPIQRQVSDAINAPSGSNTNYAGAVREQSSRKDGRACSRCHIVGHNVKTCRTILAVDTPSQQRETQDRPQPTPQPPIDFTKPKPVRWLDKSVINSFRKVATALIKIIVDGDRIDIVKEDAVLCFLYFPSVLNRSTHRSTAITIMEKWVAANDIIESILNYRSRDINTFALKKKSHRKGMTEEKKESKIKDEISRGNFSAAMQLLEDNTTIMELTDDAITKIKKMHPDPLNPFHDSTYQEESIIFDSTDIGFVIEKLPKFKSTGLSAWSNEILKRCWQGPLGDNPDEETIIFRDSITSLINVIANGKAGKNDAWINSLLIPITKDGTKIRPIAVDNIFLRLTGKLFLTRFSKDIGKILMPIQKSIGIQSGNEKIVHEATSWFSRMSLGLSTNSIAQLDLSNAFGCIDRNAILDALRKTVPEMIPYYMWSYGTSTRLYSADGRHVATSKTGVRQGDPLGPLLFCLGIQKYLEECQVTFPDTKIVAFMDDITIFGEHRDVKEAINWISERLSSIQLQLNVEKTNIYGHQIPGFPSKDEDGFSILGCPIGSDNFINRFLKKTTEEIKDLVIKSTKLPIDYCYPLLNKCMGSRFNHFLRGIHPRNTITHSREIDNNIISALEVKIGFQLNHLEKLVSKLPIRTGGLGLYHLEDQAEIAWSSSFYAYLHSQPDQARTVIESMAHQDEAVLRRNIENYPNPDLPEELHRQKFLNLKKQEKLEEDIDALLKNDSARKRMHQAQKTAPNSWLHQVIFQDSPQIMTKHQYITQLKLRLLHEVQTPTGQCKCGTVDFSDPKQIYHCLSCKDMSYFTIRRHNCVRDLIMYYVRKIDGAMCNGENTVYNSQSPENHRRYDIRVTLPMTQDPIFIDTLTMNIGALTYQSQSNEESLIQGQKLKINKYRPTLPLIVEDSRRFVPFVVDITGNIGPLGIAFIDRLHEIAKTNCPRFKTLFKRDLSLIMASEVSDTIVKFNTRQLTVAGEGNTG